MERGVQMTVLITSAYGIWGWKLCTYVPLFWNHATGPVVPTVYPAVSISTPLGEVNNQVAAGRV